MIGRGAYGIVYAGRDTSSGERIAIKRINIPMNDHTDMDAKVKKISREIQLLQRSDNVCRSLI